MEIPFKVLLVDDQKLVLDGLIEQLHWARFHGVLCGSAQNGLQALELMETIRPDVIISDIRMPVLDGIGLARRLHESTQFSDIPIIFLSGYREFEYAQRALQYHVNQYILKPITRQKLAQLEDLLTSLYQYRESSQLTFLELTDSNWQQQISNALKNHDIGKIELFFQSPFYQRCIHSSYCDSLGGQLLTLLYDYLTDIHFSPEALRASQEHTLTQFFSFPNRSDKANYLESTYFDLLNLMSKQRNKNTDALYRYAVSSIDLHYTDPNFTISHLASEMIITLSYLSTLFKQTAGCNLNSYITNKRLERACTLLACPRYSISEVAHQSGYDDPGYFSSLFRRKMGMSPTDYRNSRL